MISMRKRESTRSRPIYRVLFQNQGNLYELYAGKVDQGPLFAFVEVEDIRFGNRGGVLVDPSEEKLKSEFAGVKRTYLPLQSIVRIDVVEKVGVNKIVALPGGQGNIATFPVPQGPTRGKP